MKYFHFLFIIFIACSCNTKQKTYRQNILTASNLQTQVYEIDPAIENSIHTKNGATIRFPKDAFKLNGAGKVNVEIKEAYSMNDILLAGLTTQSNGKALSSGGMIYINAQQNNKDVALQKTAGVSMPVTNFTEGMQVFKGEYTKDSTVNWVDPKPLDSTPNKLLEAGRQMFMTNCSGCHNIKTNATGSALYNIVNRSPSKEWLYEYTRNWEGQFRATDTLAGNNAYGILNWCINQRNNLKMPYFPMLKDNDLDAIYAYIQHESIKDPQPDSLYPDYKQCYAEIVEQLKEFAKRDNEKPGEFPAVEEEKEDIFNSITYSFNIKDLGWFNIDAIINDLDGAVDAGIEVRVNKTIPGNDPDVFLAIPSRKVLYQLQPGKDGIYRSADYGQAPFRLYPDDKAYILCYINKDEDFIFGISAFVTKSTNTLSVNTTLVSRQHFTEKIKNIEKEMEKTFRESNLPGVFAPPAVNTPDSQPEQPDTASHRKGYYEGGCHCLDLFYLRSPNKPVQQ